MADAPPIEEHHIFYWMAFNDLQFARESSMAGAGYIKLETIWAYIDRHDVIDEETFEYVIRGLDVDYLARAAQAK